MDALFNGNLPDQEFLERFRQVTNKIDVKGRVSVPPAFRFEGEAGEHTHIYIVCTDPAAPRLQIRHLTWLRNIHKMLTTHDGISSSERETYLEDLFHGLSEMKLDSEGRVMLNQSQLSHAGLTTEALFIGAGDHVQIWNPVIRKIIRNYGNRQQRSLDDLLKEAHKECS